MPTIILDASGPAKGSLVAGAYEYCGLNPWEYERTPEEVSTGMRHLNGLMARLLSSGIDLGFDFPVYGNGLPEELSGIPDGAAEPVMVLLAQRLAPALGGALSGDAKAVLATAMHDLYANNAATPPSMKRDYCISGLGNRHRRFLLVAPPADGCA